MDVTQLLSPAASGGQRALTILSGYVSRNRPAPASFSDPVWVIVPSHGSDAPYGPLEWPASHGTTLPVAGTPMVLGIDDNGTPHVLWWSGVTVTSGGTPGPTGPAGAPGAPGTPGAVGPAGPPGTGTTYVGGLAGATKRDGGIANGGASSFTVKHALGVVPKTVTATPIASLVDPIYVISATSTQITFGCNDQYPPRTFYWEAVG